MRTIEDPLQTSKRLATGSDQQAAIARHPAPAPQPKMAGRPQRLPTPVRRRPTTVWLRGG